MFGWAPNAATLTGKFSATGGTITTSGGNTIHTFLTSGTFTVLSGSKSVNYLVVAGGGGGGSSFVTVTATASAFALGSVNDAPFVTISFVVTPSVMSVAVSPSSIVPDGSSTATVTATVTDDFGNGVPGEVVTFSSTDPGQVFGAVTDGGDGTYSATVTSSTTAGVATITGTDTSADLSATAALTQAAALAATGSDPGFAPGLALLLVLVGGALVVIRRTRHAASIR